MTAEEDITVESAAPLIVETQAEDKDLALGAGLMPGPLHGLRILVEDGPVRAMPHSTTRHRAAEIRIAAATVNIPVAATSNRKLQQHAAERTSSAALRSEKPTFPPNSDQ